MKKSEEFFKNIKKGSLGSLILGIIFILIAASSVGTFYFMEQNEKKNPIDLYDANETGLYSKLRVKYLLDYFAVPEDNSDEKAFIAYDENNVMYIVLLKEDDITKLQEIWDYTYADEEPEKVPSPVTIYGKTEEISGDLKKLAISYYNEVFGEEFLTNSNFKNYFGNYYLDTNMEFTESNLFYGIISGGVFGLIGLILLLVYVFRKIKTKKVLEKYNDRIYELSNAIDSEICYFNKKTKVYFTDTCIISYAHGLEIIEYKDIVWIYPHIFNNRGAVTKSIYVVTKDSKVHILSQMNITKKTGIIFDEEYQTLINRNPEVLLGYTKENAKKAKELYIKK